MAGARAGAGVAEQAEHSGQCHCGAVTFRARGLRDIWFCHCTQCRKLTGHYIAACRTRRENYAIEGELRWTPVSDESAHGFCAACCSPLFWSTASSDNMSVQAGSLEHTRGIGTCGHIFVAEKGDYYEITDGLPQYAGYPEGGMQGQ